MTGKIFSFLNLTGAALAWLLLVVPANQPIVPFTPPAPAIAFEQNFELQTAADALLPLFENMPPVAVYVTDAPVLKTGSSIENGVAYTDCAGHTRPTIFIKRDFFVKTNQKQLTNILKHELTHAWLCRQQLMAGHDAAFQRKFKEVGGFGN
jgi:hypothetical protein